MSVLEGVVMRLELFPNMSVPFQLKRLLRFTGTSIVLLSLTFSAFARDEFRSADPDDARLLIKQAEKLTRKGSFWEAEKILRRVIEKDPDNSKAKLGLSYVLLKQRRFADSYSYSFEVAKNEPKNARAFALVGMALVHFGNFRAAGTILNKAGLLNGNEPLVWTGFGMLDFYENRIDNSIEKLQTAEYLDPSDPDVCFALAQVLARAEKYKEAAEAYGRFLNVAPPSDSERRTRIKGLINFLHYLGNKQELYKIDSNAKQSVVPVQILRDRPIVEVKINGKDEKLRFVLDTGSGISVISEETARRMKIKAISKGGLARAVGGDGKFEIVYGFLQTATIGEMRVRNVPVYIRKFQDEGEKVDGYIGLSLISKFLTTVDYGNSTFTLTKKDKNTLANFENEGIALPLRLTSSGFLSGEVQLQGWDVPLNFIVDTGASISVISSNLADTSEMSRFSTDEKMRVVGAAGVTENVSSYMIPKVTFGNHTREKVKAIALDLDVINEASGFEQAGILGGNFLRNYRLTFDFQNSKVIFVPIKQ